MPSNAATAPVMSEMEAAMDTSSAQETSPQVQLDRNFGRTAIIVPGEDSSPDDNAGWTIQRRRSPQPPGEASQPSIPGKPANKAPKSPPTRKQFAARVNATLTRAARMPNNIPRSEFKIIIRPRGGMNTGRTKATELMAAITAATGITREAALRDTICPNVAQNIIVMSTPDEKRAIRYAQLRSLTVGDQVHEVFAYHAAPDDTAKGVIRNISTEDSPEEIRANIVNIYNPMAIDAHRIGSSTAVIVLFQGTKVPETVKYGAVLVRCSLYRQHREVCRTCGKIGHRQDVCPQPNARVCFACGKTNPGENHENECKPRCKLCGGPHPTGSAGCVNRFKTPYLVKKRLTADRTPFQEERTRLPATRRPSAAALPQRQERSPLGEPIRQLRRRQEREESQQEKRTCVTVARARDVGRGG